MAYQLPPQLPLLLLLLLLPMLLQVLLRPDGSSQHARDRRPWDVPSPGAAAFCGDDDGEPRHRGLRAVPQQRQDASQPALCAARALQHGALLRSQLQLRLAHALQSCQDARARCRGSARVRRRRPCRQSRASAIRACLATAADAALSAAAVSASVSVAAAAFSGGAPGGALPLGSLPDITSERHSGGAKK